jgi:ADP-ribose pyrophosphatase
MSQHFKKFSHFEWITPTPEPLLYPTFIKLQQFKLRHHFDDNTYGPVYELETVTTPCLDAVVIIIYTLTTLPQVILRQGIRPAAVCRTLLPLPGGRTEKLPPIFWELPAGGVETSDWEENPDTALLLRAKQETWEEVGLHVSAGSFFELGPSVFLASAFSPERIHFMMAGLSEAVSLDVAPPGDGHPMEQGAWAQWVCLDEALTWCRNGEVIDSKTEIGLRRLHEYLNKI